MQEYQEYLKPREFGFCVKSMHALFFLLLCFSFCFVKACGYRSQSLSPVLGEGQRNIRITTWDFPGGAVVKNPPSNAGDTGSIPGRGTKIPHAAVQLSPCAATTEPTRSGTPASYLDLLKSVSCNSALLSQPLRCLPLIYLWTRGII